jgi:hypothetical protein
MAFVFQCIDAVQVLMPMQAPERRQTPAEVSQQGILAEPLTTSAEFTGCSVLVAS